MKTINFNPYRNKKTLMINALIEIVFVITYIILIFVQPRHNFYYVSLAGILIYFLFLALSVFFYYKRVNEKTVQIFTSAFFFFQTAYLIALIPSYTPAIGRLTFRYYLYCVHCGLSLFLFINALLQHANFEYLRRRRQLIAYSIFVLLFFLSTLILTVIMIKDFVTYGFSIEYFITLISYFVYLFGTNVAFLIEYYHFKIITDRLDIVIKNNPKSVSVKVRKNTKK